VLASTVIKMFYCNCRYTMTYKSVLHLRISEDMEFLTNMNNIGVVGDSTLTAQMNYQAQLGGTHSCISTFDVQTVANKRRKLQDRKCKFCLLTSPCRAVLFSTAVSRRRVSDPVELY